MENWELKITEFWRVERNLDLSFSLPTEVKNQKNIVALAQKQDNWRIVLGLFPLRPLPPSIFFWKWRENERFNFLTDLSAAITATAGATESTSGNDCVLTKAFFGKKPSSEPREQRGTKFHYM